MSKRYKIIGGYPLKGKIRANGNKNAALPIIAASLLTDEEVIIRNIPNIEDIKIMLEIAKQIGIKVKAEGKNAYRLSGNISNTIISQELGKKIRTSILFAGPLLARCGEVHLPPPGGDVIGRRRLDTHFLALTELGSRVEIDTNFSLYTNKLVGKNIFLDECSVTATEHALMAAVLAEGKTFISNAASEPHVQDLCKFLNSMGAKITGIGSNLILIEG